MKPLAQSITPLIQRQTIEGEAQEEVQMLQRKAGGISATSNVESSLNASKGSGSPLADNAREFMETRFGADFSSVRVHTDSNAVQMNKELGAQAFTHGSDIYYGAGKTPGNNELTAHELTHVVQQTGAKKLHKEVGLRLNNKEESNKLKHNQQGARPHNSSLNKDISSSESKNNTTFIEEPSSEITKVSSEKTGELSTNFHPQLNKETPLKGKPIDASKLKASETGGKEKASLEGAPAQNLLETDIGITPKNLSNTQVKATNPATNGKLENSTPEMKAATGTATSVPASQVDATPVMESMGNTAENAGDTEQGQAGDDKELETIATATEGVELEGGERTNAMASLAEVSNSGGAVAEGAGGGGSGAAITDKPAPPVPDVSQAEPSQALAAIGQLPPAQLQVGLGNVTTAVANTVSKERSELAANPPQMERPSGSPMTKEGVAGVAVPAGKSPKPVEKAPAGQAYPVPQPQPLPPLPPPSIQSVPQPSSNPQSIKASLESLPTRDSNLNVTAGSPPPLELKGDADPKQTQEQKAKLEKSITDTHVQGQQALAQPMGEDEIYPNVPKETLKAEVIGGSAGGNGIAAGGSVSAVKGAQGDEAVSIITQQEHGQEIQSTVAQAQGQMVAQKQEHTAQVAQAKDRSNKEITKLQSESEAQQTQERAKAHIEVNQQREAWNKEQTDLVKKSRKDADSEVAKGMKNVQQEQTQAEAKATEHIEKGNQEAEIARKQGEEQASAEKRKGEQESGGIFGWLADKAKALFDGIKQAIQKAFEIARAAIKVAIETAKKLATAVIEAARKAIVTIIKAVGEALIALGDVLLAAFPAMRDRFRNAIKSVVQKAEAAVNFLADKLKQGVQAALNLLGKGLDAALGLMEKGMLAAVDIAKASVQGAISAAKAAVEALGAFAVLAKDIAASPGQWLSNLGAGVMDGIRNHLWTAFQTAVKEWFNQKVEELLGLGMTVWNLLQKGGMGMAEIGQMAWEGIKAAIPPALIQILIEKLVAMIVPAAGAVLAVIEGLQAAWGTVSRILQAMERFMAFLKVVKTGQSGPQFGQLLAAAGIVLIDFVANWLLKRVRGSANKVAGKIKEIAKKIGDKLKKATKKLGQKLRGGMKKLGDKAKKLKEKFFGKKDKKGDKHTNKGKDKKLRKEEAKQQEIQKRVEKVQCELPPKVNSLLAKHPLKLRLKAQLVLWRVQYRLQYLKVIESGNSKAEIEAKVNPKIKIADTYFFEAADLMNIVDRVAQDYVPKEVADESSLSIVHDSTGDHSKAMAGMIGNRQHLFATDSESRPVGVSSTIINDRYGNKILKIRPFEGGPGPEYGTLSQGLEGMGPQVSQYYRNIFTGQTPVALPSDKKQLADVGYGLWYVHEPAHKRFQLPGGPVPTWTNRRDLTYSMMLTELMGRGGVDPKEAFSSDKLDSSRGRLDITSHPAAFNGAQEGAREMNKKMKRREKATEKGEDYKWGLGNNQNARERFFREKQLIKKWFSLHKAEFLKAYPKKPSETELEEFVRNKLKEYFAHKSD
ncbi:hypothetical protein NUACC21_54010 [Scytonema sp. NUACC21]